MGWIKTSKANLYVKSIDLTVWEGEYFWENKWFAKQNQWGSFRSVCSNIVLGPTLLSLISWFMVLRLQKESREGERVWSERSCFFLYLSEYNNKTWGERTRKCCWAIWKIICEAPKHWGSKTVHLYSKNTRMNEKTIKVMFEHSTSNMRSSGPHWCRLEKRSSLLILFSLHVQAPTSFFTPTVLLIHSPKKNIVYINVPHSRFLPFLFISSSLLSAAP